MTLRVLVLVNSAARSRYFEEALPLLRAAGVDAELATLGPFGPLHVVLRHAGVPVHALRQRHLAESPATVLRLRRLLARRGYAILHAHEAVPALAAGLAVRGRREVSLYHRHHLSGTRQHRLVSRPATLLAARVIVVSQTAAHAAAREDRLPAEKVVVAYNGVPAHRKVPEEERSALRRSLGLSDADEVVVCVGRMRVEKGQHVLLDAFEIMQPPCSRHLVLVGDGPTRHELAQRSATASFAVHLLGHQDDVDPCLAIADVVAVPSLQEAFGLAAVEALAARRPLVATDAGALPEVVAGAALLVPAGDARRLAAGIDRLLEDRREAARLAAAGYALFTRRYSVATMVDRWASIYSAVLSERR